MIYKKVFAGVVLLTVLAPMNTLGASFTDVGAEFSGKLDVLISHGIVENGESFNPTRKVNRAEAAKMILATRGIALGKEETPRFKDVDGKAWYAPYIAAASDIEVLKGFPDGTVRPANGVKKAEFFTMLYRMHKAYFTVPKVSAVVDTYEDVTKSEWYFEPVAWALGSFYKKTGEKFDPNNDLTREDVAHIMLEYVTYFSKEIAAKGFGVISSEPFYAPQSDAESRNETGRYEAESMTMSPDDKMASTLPYYPGTIYRSQVKYEYTGRPLEGLGEDVAVYKMITGDQGFPVSVEALTAVVPGFLHGIVDQLQPGSIMVESINFVTGLGNEYRYYLDLAYGSFSISEDYRQARGDEVAYDALTDAPNPLQLTSKAKDFLKSMGISLEGYGPGEVDLSWRDYGDGYIPEYHNVVFPKLVDGMSVYSEWGYPDQALNASIFAPKMKISNVNGYFDGKRVGSNYASKDWSSVLEDALNGGVNSPYVPYYPEEPYYFDVQDLPMPLALPNGEEVTMSSGMTISEIPSPKVPEKIEYIDQTVTVSLSKAEKVMILVRSYEAGDYYRPRQFYVPGVMFQGVARIATPGEETRTDSNIRVMVPLVTEEFFDKPGTYMYAKG